MNAAQPFDAGAAELVGPLTQSSDGERMTVAQAARLAGVSPATLHRRIEAGELPAERDGRAYRISKKVVLEFGDLRKRDAPRSRADRARDTGALAARAFPLFRATVPLDEIVERLEVDPDAVLKLHEQWLRCRQRTALWLTAETQAPAAGPTFDHVPNESWTCCPGHTAMHAMEKR